MSRQAAAAVALLIAAAAFPARSEPKFAARMGMPCAVCHVNPTGGGLRTAHGREVFERQQLTFEAGAGLGQALSFDPRVWDLIALGGDFRLAFIGQPARKPTDVSSPGPGLFVKTPTWFTFFPMQVDLYVGAEISRHVALSVDLGANGSYEAFGLVHDLPLGGYVKAGIFIPPYGTKLPNHTAAHRAPIGFDPRGKDAGVEFGMVRSWLDAAVAIQNGEVSGVSIDQSEGFSVTARVALLQRLGPLKATVGASVRHVSSKFAPSDPRDPASAPTAAEQHAGPFLWLALGRFTYLAEVDIHLVADGSKPDANGAPGRSGQYVAYQELEILVARGVDLGITHEFMDRDAHGRTDPPDTVQRFGLLASIFPAPYVSAELFLRAYQARKDREENGQWEAIAFLHLFF